MKRALLVVAALASGCTAPAPPAVDARVSCAADGHALRRTCTVTLRERQTGQSVEGATVTLSADMPSMPLQHSIRPAPAVPAGSPGTYRGTLELDMLGRWVVAVRVAGPINDQFTHTLDVD